VVLATPLWHNRDMIMDRWLGFTLACDLHAMRQTPPDQADQQRHFGHLHR
jgi:hypothetical protein